MPATQSNSRGLEGVANQRLATGCQPKGEMRHRKPKGVSESQVARWLAKPEPREGGSAYRGWSNSKVVV